MIQTTTRVLLCLWAHLCIYPLFFLLINTLLVSLLSVSLWKFILCKAYGTRALSLATGLEARIQRSHWCSLTSVSGWEQNPASSRCRLRPPEITNKTEGTDGTQRVWDGDTVENEGTTWPRNRMLPVLLPTNWYFILVSQCIIWYIRNPQDFLRTVLAQAETCQNEKSLWVLKILWGESRARFLSCINTGHFNEKGRMSQRLPRGWPGEPWRTIPRSRASSTCPVDSGIAVDHWLLCTF